MKPIITVTTGLILASAALAQDTGKLPAQVPTGAAQVKSVQTGAKKLATDEQHQAVAAERRGMVGTGERAEKIRTYNYPQNRITDHRLGLTLHQLDQLLEGELDELLTALRNDHQATLLAAQAER
jgi:peptide chain release factor 1